MPLRFITPPKKTATPRVRARTKGETGKAALAEAMSDLDTMVKVTIDPPPKSAPRRIRVHRNAAGDKTFIIEKVKIVRADPDLRIRLLRTGFPAAVVTELADEMGWSREHAIDTFRFKRSTVLRKIKKDERLDTSESERLLSVMDIIDQVQSMVERSGDPTGFDASKWVADWLETPVPALGDKRPAEYLDTNEGVLIVRRLLAQMETGAYA